MPDGLYDRDVLEWSERQADLLRRLANGERVNDALDWPNVIEEVESVGRSALNRCQSLLVQALIHVLKIGMWPSSQAALHWRGDAAGFLADAQRSYSPSMRQKIDLADLYADAIYRLASAIDDSGPKRSLPDACPFSLDELLAHRPDISALAVKIGSL